MLLLPARRPRLAVSVRAVRASIGHVFRSPASVQGPAAGRSRGRPASSSSCWSSPAIVDGDLRRHLSRCTRRPSTRSGRRARPVLPRPADRPGDLLGHPRRMVGIRFGKGIEVWFVEKLLKLTLLVAGRRCHRRPDPGRSRQLTHRGYFATCARGLEPVLARELAGLGADDVAPGRGGVAFAGDTGPALPGEPLAAHRRPRPAAGPRGRRPLARRAVRRRPHHRLVRVPDARTTRSPSIATSATRRSPTRSTPPGGSRTRSATSSASGSAAGRAWTPSGRWSGINLHVYRDHAILSLDSSWDSLHKRGYRPIQTSAPLNEALAAGLLLAPGWDGTTPLVDPLCGSGTFCDRGGVDRH